MEREEHEREALERAEGLESKGRTDSQQNCWRENTGIKKGFTGSGSRDKLMVILQMLSTHREITLSCFHLAFWVFRFFQQFKNLGIN